MEFLKKIDFDYQFIKGNIYVKNLVFFFLNHIELIIHIASAHEEQHIQWCRKGMVRELKVLHKNPETSYVEEGFSGI